MIDSQAGRGKGFSIFGDPDKRTPCCGLGVAGLRKALDSYRRRKKIGEVPLNAEVINSSQLEEASPNSV
jgi:hypothetical protein